MLDVAELLLLQQIADHPDHVAGAAPRHRAEGLETDRSRGVVEQSAERLGRLGRGDLRERLSDRLADPLVGVAHLAGEAGDSLGELHLAAQLGGVADHVPLLVAQVLDDRVGALAHLGDGGVVPPPLPHAHRLHQEVHQNLGRVGAKPPQEGDDLLLALPVGQPRDHRQVLAGQQALELDAVGAADQLGGRLGLRFDQQQRDLQQAVPVLPRDRIAAHLKHGVERRPLARRAGARDAFDGLRGRLVERDVLELLVERVAPLEVGEVEADALLLDRLEHGPRAPRHRAEDVEAFIAPGEGDVLARLAQRHQEILKGAVRAAERREHGGESEQILVAHAGGQLDLPDAVDPELLGEQRGARGIERHVESVQPQRVLLGLDAEPAGQQLAPERGHQRVPVLFRVRFVAHDVEQRAEQRGGRVRTCHRELRSQAGCSPR